MQPIDQLHSSTENQNSTSHPSATISSGEGGLSVLGDDDTISSISASSSQAREDMPVWLNSSDISASAEMADEARFGNSTARPNARTVQFNQQSDSQHPSEETSMMSAHESSIDDNIHRRSWKYKLRKAARGWWLWEIGGAALSIGCMIAILIILPCIHNQPLKNWSFMIAPNTMISTLITVSKTSMLLAVATGMGQLKWQHFHRDTRPISELDIYDEASRGPWGALAFILISPFRWRDTIAILGAFVMLSSLTMEPLAQQLLSFQTRNILQKDGNAWITTTSSYGKESIQSSGELEVRAQSLILQGILGLAPSLSYTCSSSNCSWPDFRALGICSSCANVTSDCLVTDATSPEEKYVIGTPSLKMNYTTPKGIKLTFNKPLTIIKELGGIVMSGNVTGNDNTNLMNIVSVAVANASRPYRSDEPYTGYDFNQPDITECTISWCAKFYSNMKMVNGTLNQYTVEEKLFSSQEVPGIGRDPIALQRCLGWTRRNVAFQATRGGESYQFTVACARIAAVAQYFSDFFQFQVHDTDSSLASGQLIINTDSVPVAMDAITNAFSIYLMTSTSNTTRHYGEAFYPEVFVIIRWQWLIFPGILTILGTSFLGTSLWISRKYRTSFLWKASLVPLLFHGLSGWEKDDLHTKDKIEMDERAKRMMAKLEMDDGGSLKFVKA